MGIDDIATGCIVLVVVLASGEEIAISEFKVWGTFLGISLDEGRLRLGSGERTRNGGKSNNEVSERDHGGGNE